MDTHFILLQQAASFQSQPVMLLRADSVVVVDAFLDFGFQQTTP